MKCILIAGLLFLVTFNGISQNRSTTIGFEIDALPYLTGGYYGSFWIGNNHLRYRGVVAKTTVPDFLVKDGFTENKIQAYAFITDYFFKPNFQKWWIAAGIEYWKGQIQTDARQSTSEYENAMFTTGGGYVWKFYKNFYLNPWVGIHLRVAGDDRVVVDTKEFTPPFFTPEISLKIGWHL